MIPNPNPNPNWEELAHQTLENDIFNIMKKQQAAIEKKRLKSDFAAVPLDDWEVYLIESCLYRTATKYARDFCLHEGD